MTPTPPDKDELDEILKLHASYHYGGGREGELSDERAKQAINRLITQSNKDLLERVRSEVLKTPECNCKHAREMVKPQRSALQNIEDEIKGEVE